jgi:hypothetical protein
MTGTPTPSDGISQLRARLGDIEQRLRALETQQYQVFTDPTQTSGDASHGYAKVVIGSLKAICGISQFGLAVWNSNTTTGAWAQIL